MKRLVLVSLLFVGCEKEKPCNCGTIVSDSAMDYSVTIENECTGNQKKFQLDQSNWYTANIGDYYCITNSPKW